MCREAVQPVLTTTEAFLMQAELDKVSSLLQQAAKSFESQVEDEACTRLTEASAILEEVITQQACSESARPRVKSVAA
jgi:hypothetical protein